MQKTAQKGGIAIFRFTDGIHRFFWNILGIRLGRRDQIKWHIKEKEYNITFGQVYDSVTIGEAKPALPFQHQMKTGHTGWVC
ncbi:hypothetical protein RHA96_12665 [Citrobacter freundii]|nr:hypothetical protein RHA96_12665 [Citrobacter freundii]